MKLRHSLNLIDWVHDANPFVSHSLKKPWDTTLNFTPFRNYTQHASGKNVQLLYPNIRKDIMSLGAVSRNKSGQKSDIVWLGRDPPLPPVKSDTFLKNIFIAFLSSTAFVCYLEMNLFFSHPKIRRKNLE